MKNYVNQENDGSDAVILQILKFRFNCVGCINAVSCTKMIWNTKVYDASLIHSTSFQHSPADLKPLKVVWEKD